MAVIPRPGFTFRARFHLDSVPDSNQYLFDFGESPIYNRICAYIDDYLNLNFKIFDDNGTEVLVSFLHEDYDFSNLNFDFSVCFYFSNELLFVLSNFDDDVLRNSQFVSDFDMDFDKAFTAEFYRARSMEGGQVLEADFELFEFMPKAEEALVFNKL